MQNKRGKIDLAILKFYILIFLIIAAIIISIFLHIRGFHIMELLKNLPSYKYSSLIFIGLYVAISFIPIPIAPLSFVGAYLFPSIQAFIYTLIGHVLFATIMFYLVKWLGRGFVLKQEKKNKNLRNLDDMLGKNAFLNLIMLRLFFIIPPEFVNIISGLSEIKFKDYFLATIIGITPVLVFSIMLIKAEMYNNLTWLAISLIGAFLMIVIPIIFIAKLRKYFKDKVKKHIHNI